MDDDLNELRDRLGVGFHRKARMTKATVLWVKVGLILVGTLISGVAAFFSQTQLWPLSGAQIFGIVGVLLASIGGFFVLLTEEDTSDLLEDARRALDEASSQQSAAQDLFYGLLEYEEAVDRLAALYTAMSLARGTVEQAVLLGAKSEQDLVKACLDSSKRELKIALGFDVSEVWTIGIYKAVEITLGGKVELELIAADRSVPTDIKDARRWKEGVGVGGIAYAKNDEVVAPNLDDPAVGTVFKLDGDYLRSEDRERYKSLFAVPVSVGVDKAPWGAVLATSSVPDYFGADDNVGVDPEEAVRALAGIVALAVATHRSHQPERADS